MKRLFDIVFSTAVLILFLPFGILIALLISVESRGGIFYSQERVGRNESTFKLFKFRTMRRNADRLGKLTIGMRDPRITRVGYFLRKTKLDEFPQFVNVLIGDMSVVGPRPEVREYVDLYTAEEKKVLHVRPGITDYASLEFYAENELLGTSENPNETYVKEIMPTKLKLNMKYIQEAGFLTDLKVIKRTFFKMFS
jgi:lipopolysaccharide/colanic/teichoic acid biosynthesis glycosyltransferase